MTWNQLGEMRHGGVDIEAHVVSHHDLRHARRGQDYTTGLHNEVYGCKETLENKLGVKIIALAFPYGFHNEVVRKTAKEAGYEMQFTVYGRRMDINVPADQIGRYAIDSPKGDVFKAALNFGASDSTQPGVDTSQLASAAMLTEPLNDQHITEPKRRAADSTHGIPVSTYAPCAFRRWRRIRAAQRLAFPSRPAVRFAPPVLNAQARQWLLFEMQCQRQSEQSFPDPSQRASPQSRFRAL